MKKKLLAVMMIPLACTAKAQETSQLEEITVSADWLGAATPEAAKKHPGARTVITSEDLTESGARTIEDALRTVPGVRVLDESGTGILPNIGIRGLSPLRSEQVLVLVDGMPVSLAPYGQTGLSLFPLTINSIEAIDVVRGGVATHYGPNNVGGAINFISKRIPRKPSWTARESLSVFGSGHVLSDTYMRVGGFVSERLGVQAQANVIAGNAEREHSKTEVGNLMLDADWFVTDNAEIKAGLQYYKTENDLPGALTPTSYAEDREQSTRPHDRFNGDTVRGYGVYNHYFSNGAELRWANFAHRSNREFFFGNSTNADVPSTQEMSAPRSFWVYGSEPRLTFNVGGAVKQKISVGARYMREEVDYLVHSRNLATNAFSTPRDWRFENDAFAAYLSDTFLLDNDRLKITPGIRYENIDSYRRDNRTGLQGTNTTRDWLPGIDVGYQAGDSLFLFANFHESLRPVQFTQVTYGGENLAAERANNYEVGVRMSPSQSLDIGLTAFRFDFDNKLEYVAALSAFRNLGEARHQGVEAELAWRPETVRGLEFKTGYTFVDTEQLSGQFEGNKLPLAPTHQINVEANYRSGPWNWNVTGLYHSAAFSDGANTVTESTNGSVGRIPSYAVWNAQLTRDFRWNGTQMKAALALNNLFDRDYYFRGVDFSQGRMPAPGRAALLTLQMDM